VNGKSVNIPGGASAVAAIDTGTSLIGAPTAAVQAIWGAVPGSVPLSGEQAGYFAFRTLCFPSPFPLACALRPRIRDFVPQSFADELFHTACSTQLTLAISFGGPAWPIRAADLNLGTIGNGRCLGAVFDLSQGSNSQPGGVNPSWIIGDTFLVRFSHGLASPHADGVAYGCRKTCTVSSAPIRQLSASHSCQTRLVVHPVSSVPFFMLRVIPRSQTCLRLLLSCTAPTFAALEVSLLMHNLVI
jgi:hypothetical protein